MSFELILELNFWTDSRYSLKLKPPDSPVGSTLRQCHAAFQVNLLASWLQQASPHQGVFHLNKSRSPSGWWPWACICLCVDVCGCVCMGVCVLPALIWAMSDTLSFSIESLWGWVGRLRNTLWCGPSNELIGNSETYLFFISSKQELHLSRGSGLSMLQNFKT